MILVVLGTEKYVFTRPLVQLESYAKDFCINEKIVVQAGFTVYESDRMEIFPFLKSSELEELYRQARVVICHGGTGSVVAGVKLRKKVVVVPRLKKYHEHIDDHQLELVAAFEAQNYILPWLEHDELSEVFDKLNGFQPSDFVSGKDAILAYVKQFIEQL